MSAAVRRSITRWLIQAALGAAGYGAILFLAAGRLDWLWGWLFWGILVLMLAAHPILLIPVNPELLAERQKGTQAAGVKTWDKRITLSSGLLMIVSWIVAGLDWRWSWSPALPGWLHWLALLLTAAGYALFMWAMTANAFFSEGVRIQTERDHQVASGGPYRFVRHPGYLGVIIAHLSTPILLGSLWSLLPSACLAALFVLRTKLEDAMLQAELPGYDDFAARTRYRLLPRVW